MIDADERAALERALAADLERLELDDDREDAESDQEADALTSGWRRRDLDELLASVGRQVEEDQRATGERFTWALLLQSVEQRDREVFDAMRAEIDDLRATVETLEEGVEQPEEPSVVQDAAGEETPDAEDSIEKPFATLPVVLEASSGPVREPASDPSNDCRDGDSSRCGHGRAPFDAEMSPGTPPQEQIAPVPASVASLPPSPEPSDASVTAAGGTQDASVSWPRLAQQRWAQQQLETAQWLSQLEADVQRLRDEQQQRDQERFEAAERELMAWEERLARRHGEQQRELQCAAGMRVEDALSLAWNAHARLERRRERTAREELQAEDAASRLAERWAVEQAAERRIQQETHLVRRAFARVLFSLVERHREQQAERRKRLELERRREARENSLMRSEEALTRRWLAQTRAEAAERERRRNRALMSLEDALALEVRAARADERRRCLEMHGQEVWSARAWALELETAARERERQREARRRTGALGLRAWTRRRGLRTALGTWRRVVHAGRERKEMAARLQRWWRARHVPGDGGGGWGDEAADAAMLVQSTFRGFFVRRKFQTALELARDVGGGDDDSAFRAVDLDELIELPPELADGWEDPVLPRVLSRRALALPSATDEPQDAREEEEEELEELEEEEEEQENARVEAPRGSRNNVEDADAAPLAAKEATRAASLWSKMMRSKHKQRQGLEERERLQDPTYRVQKLLRPKRSGKPRAPPASWSTPATDKGPTLTPPTIAWTTSGNAPKPKPKLPSLVERLRNKTAAERGSR